MNRNPKTGDVVQMSGKRAEFLVTSSGRDLVEDVGYVGMCSWFTAVPAKATDPLTGGIDAKKEKRYFLDPVPGTKYKPVVPLADIQLTATAKFRVNKQYIVTKLSDV